ncbi:hypothetical protein ACWCPF_41570 [Streptomyces sp. NPDC001858]
MQIGQVFRQFQYPTSPLVSQERRRDAVDRVVALQVDRNGTRVWRKAQSLLDSEHVRRAIGEVSVPHGVPGALERRGRRTELPYPVPLCGL